MLAVDFYQQVVVVDVFALVGIIGGALDRVGVGAGSAGDEVSYAAVLVALVVVDVSGENDEAGVGGGLAVFQQFREILFLTAGFVAFADHVGRGTGVGRMMQHQENEIDAGGKVVELALEPLALRAGDFVERAVKDEDQCVGGADGVVAIFAEVGKALEIICERDLFVAVHFVVADGGENGNIFVAPDGGFFVKDFPVVFVGALVDDVASEADECGMGAGDGVDQRPAHGRTGGVGVARIVEARVSVGDEAKRDGDVDDEVGRGSLRGRLFRTAGEGELRQQHCEQD